MANPGGPLDGVRVAILCDDAPVRDGCAAQVHEWGAVAYARARLGDLAAVAEMCAVVLVFADDFDDAALLQHLEGIERWRDGPTLLVVSDRSPPPWTPTRERERPAVLVARSEWTARLLDLAAAPTEPELPQTD